MTAQAVTNLPYRLGRRLLRRTTSSPISMTRTYAGHEAPLIFAWTSYLKHMRLAAGGTVTPVCDASNMGSAVVTEVGEAPRARFDDLVVAKCDAIDGRALGERLRELERLARRVEHAVVGVVGEADRRGVWAADGHRSVRGWCQATVNWSGVEAVHRVRTVALFDGVGEVSDALGAGSIGVAQVRELARARSNPRCGDELVDCADVIVDHAESLPFHEFRLLVGRWEAIGDVDGAERSHQQAHAARQASIEPLGDGFTINGECGVAQGAAMAEVLERFTDSEFQADWQDAHSRVGDDVTAADLERTGAQRRMDALHAIFAAAAAAGPGSKAPDPVVNIVVDQATFEAALAAMVADTALNEVMPSVSDPTTRRCETIDGTPVDPCDAVTAAFIGHTRRVVFDSQSCTINLGVARRLFRGTSRLAVWLQGTRCL